MVLEYSNKVFMIIKKIVDRFAILFIPIYYFFYLVPRDNKIWLFGSNMGKSFGDNPKYFYLYMNHIKDRDIRPIWISNIDDIIRTLRENGYEAYSIYSLKGIFFALRSGVYIFDHHTKDISFWLSGGAKKINLFHGIPLKKIHGDNKFDQVRNPSNFYAKVRWIVRRIQNEQPNHYYLATSVYVRDIFKGAFRTSIDKGIVCGYPRNDVFFNNNYLINNKNLSIKNIEVYNRLDREKQNGKKTIMYMPTFRMSESNFFDIVNMELLNGFLENNNCVLLVKAHPMSILKEGFNHIEYENILNIDSAEDPYLFLNLSDILITDYSSIYFDFLLTNRPIIFFAYDLKEYVSESRELYYDYNSITPGHKAENIDELIKALGYILSDNDEFEKERKDILNIMFDYNDGNSSERLYDEILDII